MFNVRSFTIRVLDDHDSLLGSISGKGNPLFFFLPWLSFFFNSLGQAGLLMNETIKTHVACVSYGWSCYAQIYFRFGTTVSKTKDISENSTTVDSSQYGVEATGFWIRV